MQGKKYEEKEMKISTSEEMQEEEYTRGRRGRESHLLPTVTKSDAVSKFKELLTLQTYIPLSESKLLLTDNVFCWVPMIRTLPSDVGDRRVELWYHRMLILGEAVMVQVMVKVEPASRN